jgi:hypothetical protein
MHWQPSAPNFDLAMTRMALTGLSSPGKLNSPSPPPAILPTAPLRSPLRVQDGRHKRTTP